ncbi:MAG: Fic family protein [Deltaproteobacteria bacterium]|nr:Fic family protein [Deltaproteobacteria bacterium]
MKRYIWQHSRWPSFRWDGNALLVPLGRARSMQARLLARMESLGLDASARARADALVEESVRTAEIEGERLDRTRLRSSVARRLGLPTAGLPAPTPSEDGLVQVLLDATTGAEAALTVARLKGWQAALFPTGYSGLRPIRVGRWRNRDPMQVVSGPVGRERVHFEAPPSQRVSAEVRRFLRWWRSRPRYLDGLVRAGVAHLWFVTIHPFEDGNGRIARALTDMALAQDEGARVRPYSVSAQIMAERERYYAALQQCQQGDLDITDWLAWFLGCLERAMVRAELGLATALRNEALWRLPATAELNASQRKVLGKLVEAGPGGFQGGLTTRKYVAMTRTSRATAFRELARLVALGFLRQSGAGRSVRYDLVLPDLERDGNR